MLRHLTGCVLLLISLGACATLPKSNPRAEAKLQEANAALDALSADIRVFYEDLEPLLLAIGNLSEHPGWIDMQTLIASSEEPSLGEEKTLLEREREDGFPAWTAGWGETGEELFVQYQALADRCSIFEARRIGLIGRLVAMEAWYLEITFLELSANRQSQAEAAYSTVEVLSNTQDELESFTLDAVGLYEAAPRG